MTAEIPFHSGLSELLALSAQLREQSQRARQAGSELKRKSDRCRQMRDLVRQVLQKLQQREEVWSRENRVPFSEHPSNDRGHRIARLHLRRAQEKLERLVRSHSSIEELRSARQEVQTTQQILDRINEQLTPAQRRQLFVETVDIEVDHCSPGDRVTTCSQSSTALLREKHSLVCSGAPL